MTSVRRIVIFEDPVPEGEDPDEFAERIPAIQGARLIFHQSFPVSAGRGYLNMSEVHNDLLSRYLDPSGVREGIPIAEATKKLHQLIALANATLQKIS